LGNEALAQEVAANLALFLGRLGRSQDQLECAQKYSRASGTELFSFVEIQLTYSAAVALGRLGRPAEALRTLTDFDPRLGTHLPGWILQPWLLWKADALMISGFREEAIQVASRAIRGYELRLEASAFAGCFARWLVLVCRPDETTQSRYILRQLSRDIEEYDRIDQLEILCANAKVGVDDSMLAHRIREKLLHLPTCTWAHMKELQVVT